MPMPFDTQFEDEPIGPLSKMSAPVRKADGDSVRATTASGKAINRGKSRMDQEAGRKPLNIVKEEGGQWINNTPLSVESQLEDAYKKSMIGADQPTHNQAINNWIDRNLNKYIKKQMGTSKDPIRLLAEQGITHFTPENYGTQGSELRRRHAGYDPEGVGVSPQAKLWENVSDRAIDFKKAGEYAYPTINDESRVNFDHYKYMNERSQNPWLAGLPPETKIYETNPETFNYDLGFEHIIDILSEDLATGRLQTEDLKNVSIDRAVRRAHEYNQELNAELDAAKAQARKDLPVHKEYQDGYKWIQLNKPGSFAAESQAMGHSVRGYEPPKGHPDWIEASGDAGRDSYGHGGWEAIKSGKAKIYSLIDKSGEPHVTIETKRYPHPISWSRKDKNEFPERDTFKFEPNGFYGLLTKEKKQVSDQIYNKAKEDWLKNGGDPENHFQNAADELVFKNPEDITQIKRKSNRVADEDHPYKPYIQDFIKSGNWDDIKDIANASMYGVHDHPEIVKKYGTPWITQEEYDESFNDLYSGKPKKEPGMKKGGSFATNIAQMRHELGIKHMNEGGLPNGLESPNPYDEAPRLMSPNDQPLRSDIEVERFKKDMMQRSQLLRKASPDDIRLQLNAQAEMGEKDRGGGTRIGALIPVNLGSMGRLTINPFTSGQAFKGEGQKSQGHWNKPGININWQKQFDNGGSVKGKQPLIPKKTVKAYKLFRVDEKKPGKLFPLFVDANSPVEKDQWVAAKSGEMSGEKVKSKIGPLAYRPGWHAGDLPVATHIGGKSSSDLTKPDHRPNNQVWAEVEMPNDVDWQSEANKRGTNKQGKLIASRAHITDQIPEGGHYRYKTNPNMTGNWLIGGAMKVNKVLPDKEVQKINKKAKVADLPREEPIDLKRYGFRSGGGVQPLIPRFKD